MLLRIALVIALALPFGAQAEEACPFPGQRPMLVAEMFFGQGHSAAAWRGFLARTVTPRFPAGFTVYDAYGQWMNPDTHRIAHERTKVIMVALEDMPETRAAIAAVAQAYRDRFKQSSVGIVTTKSCAVF